MIGLEWRIQTGSYEGQNGQSVYITDVVADSIQFLEPRSNSGASGPQNNQPYYQDQPNQQQRQPSQYGGQAYGKNQPSYGGGNHNNNLVALCQVKVLMTMVLTGKISHI